MRLVAALLAASFAVAGTAAAVAATAGKDGLPAYVTGYQQWQRINKKPIVGGSSAHTGTKNVYTSRRKSGARFPAGTIIVKAGSHPGRKWIYLIAVMRKGKGSNPAANDWQMVEYTRSSPTGTFSKLAEGQLCLSCHVLAKSNDYVYTRG